MDALHIWSEKDPVDEYNNKRLEQLSLPLSILKATDQYPSQVTQRDINTVLSKARSDTGGFNFEVKIKGARVMLTTKIVGRAQFQADFTMILIQLLTGHYLG